MATDKACDLYVLSVVNTIHQGLTDWGGWGGECMVHAVWEIYISSYWNHKEF